MNFKTILDAWIIANNPTDQQKKLADARLDICNLCPSKTELVKKLQLTVICMECGCPIIKKVHTNLFDSCPLGKWKDVDTILFPTQKTEKSLF